jgi:hypothetical protein
MHSMMRPKLTGLLAVVSPGGTLTELNDVLADGSPEFPDKVIGA